MDASRAISKLNLRRVKAGQKSLVLTGNRSRRQLLKMGVSTETFATARSMVGSKQNWQTAFACLPDEEKQSPMFQSIAVIFTICGLAPPLSLTFNSFVYETPSPVDVNLTVNVQVWF